MAKDHVGDEAWPRWGRGMATLRLNGAKIGTEPPLISPNYCLEVAQETNVTFVGKLAGLGGIYGQGPRWGRDMATLGTRHGHVGDKAYISHVERGNGNAFGLKTCICTLH